MSEFKTKYDQVLNGIGGVSGSNHSAIYADKINTSISEAVEALNAEAIRCTNVDVNYLKGWLSEQWHVGTFNIDKTVKENEQVWAYVMGNNKPGVDIVYGNQNTYKSAELKYYSNGTNTAKAISRPDYINHDKIVPSDQIEAVRESAQKIATKIESYRPEQAENYQDTANRASDHIGIDNIKSKPLDEVTAKEMAKDYKKDGQIIPEKFNLTSENFVLWSNIARKSGEAALNAAILSGAISAAPYIYTVLKTRWV